MQMSHKHKAAHKKRTQGKGGTTLTALTAQVTPSTVWKTLPFSGSGQPGPRGRLLNPASLPMRSTLHARKRQRKKEREELEEKERGDI